jgi:hypothetical protein
MSHDCCNTSNKKNVKKGGPDKFLAGVVIITVLILALAVFFGTRMGETIQVTTDTQVAISVDSNRYDWGTIDLNGGIVSKSFAIENSGSILLKLYDVKTSCMCTTAQLKTTEKTSNKFGMHEKSSSVFEVKPGETAELVVEFDPAFHGPSGTGPISRTITMNTNDAKNPTLSFNLTATVVKQ